jgi:3-oxoacyl-[acyl-carrier protein] reductase
MGARTEIPEMNATRVVLISGAAGGFGRTLVETFAAEGWRVAAGYHRAVFEPETEAVWPVALDVTRRESAEEAVGGVMARWGRIDALVNNAGITADHLIGQMREEDWDTVLDVNLKGTFLCSKAVLRPMLRQRNGHIINIGSYSGRAGQRGQTNYAAAKAGLIGLTTSLAREVGARSIRVNAVLPGVLPTPMSERLDPGQLDELARANVLGRLNALPEAARFVVFLAGMENVSGQVFQIDSRIAR